jgi:ketosteroid isomerase-like protein
VVKRWLFRIVLIAGLIAFGVWAWHFFFPGPERLIGKQLSQLARVATIAPNESQPGGLADAQKLTTFFTPDAELVVDVPGRLQHTFSGRDEIRDAAAGVRATLRSLSVEFFDIVTTVAPDKKSAVAQLTAKATMPGENVPEVQRIKAEFKNIDGEWLINRAETVKALR